MVGTDYLGERSSSNERDRSHKISLERKKLEKLGKKKLSVFDRYDIADLFLVFSLILCVGPSFSCVACANTM